MRCWWRSGLSVVEPVATRGDRALLSGAVEFDKECDERSRSLLSNGVLIGVSARGCGLFVLGCCGGGWWALRI